MILAVATILAVVGVIAAVPLQAELPSQCFNHMNLSDPWRSVQADITATNCDEKFYFSAGWYRLTLDGLDAILPRTCPGHTGTCGTHYPFWYSGIMPVYAGETVKGLATSYAYPYMNCYEHPLDIQVTHCGSYYVYYLIPIDVVCPSGYCLDYAPGTITAGTTADPGTTVTTPYYTAPPHQGGTCLDNWVSWGAHCYYFSPAVSYASWFDAASMCALSNATLASVHSEAENEFIFSSMVPQGFVYATWIGLKLNAEGDFVWVDGTEVQFTKWAAGQPVYQTDQQCAILAITDYAYDVPRYWRSDLCYDDFHMFVCKANQMPAAH